jgi:Lrp/AsnC family transcriptional regulator, leucine-responsive regulatory protein
MAFRIERGLDDVGWRILAVLQEDARLSFSELGRRVGLSPPAAAERVRRLEEAGIITGYHVALGLEKLGFPMTAIIRVTAPEEKFQQLKTTVRDLDEVLECHHVTGADSLVLKVGAVSVAHLERVIEALARHGTPTTGIHPVVAGLASRDPRTSGVRGRVAWAPTLGRRAGQFKGSSGSKKVNGERRAASIAWPEPRLAPLGALTQQGLEEPAVERVRLDDGDARAHPGSRHLQAIGEGRAAPRQEERVGRLAREVYGSTPFQLLAVRALMTGSPIPRLPAMPARRFRLRCGWPLRAAKPSSAWC